MYGTSLGLVTVTMIGALALPALAQPGAIPELTHDRLPEPELAPDEEQPYPDEGAPEAYPQGTGQPPGPAQPPPGSTQATFVSTTSQGWEVLLDRIPACATPCSIYVEPMRFVTLRSQEQSPVLLEVGQLSPGSVVVRGKHLENGKYAGGIVGTTFAGMGLATGITLTAVGCSTDSRGMCTAGLITGGVSAVGLYLSIQLMRSALPKAEVLPGRPYVAGNTVGLAGTF